MKLEVKDKYFREVYEQLKSFGFQVWIPENLYNDDFRYAWVTDGEKILYYEINELEGLKWGTECVPHKDTGHGCRVHISFPLTKEKIIAAMNTRHGTPYRDFEQFKQHEEKWHKIIQL